jgi:hypothetical protein
MRQDLSGDGDCSSLFPATLPGSHGSMCRTERSAADACLLADPRWHAERGREGAVRLMIAAPLPPSGRTILRNSGAAVRGAHRSAAAPLLRLLLVGMKQAPRTPSVVEPYRRDSVVIATACPIPAAVLSARPDPPRQATRTRFLSASGITKVKSCAVRITYNPSNFLTFNVGTQKRPALPSVAFLSEIRMPGDYLRRELTLCNERALQCRTLAQRATLNDVREWYDASAQSWEYLAQQVQQTIAGRVAA